LLELTTAYCAFAGGGTGAWPYGIAEIRDTGGKVLFRREGGGPGRVIDPIHAAELNRMLAGVIGTGTGRAAQIGRPAAGKTGTTSDFRDALFVGFSGDLVAGVWFGNDDDTPMNHVTGGTLPARTWHDFMVAGLQGKPVTPLPGPPPDAPAATAGSDDPFSALLRSLTEPQAASHP
jgi:penicillin-binding protein 1A